MKSRVSAIVGQGQVSYTIPIKPPLFARCKSTNYLPNALVVMEAKDNGTDNGDGCLLTCNRSRLKGDPGFSGGLW